MSAIMSFVRAAFVTREAVWDGCGLNLRDLTGEREGDRERESEGGRKEENR